MFATQQDNMLIFRIKHTIGMGGSWKYIFPFCIGGRELYLLSLPDAKRSELGWERGAGQNPELLCNLSGSPLPDLLQVIAHCTKLPQRDGCPLQPCLMTDQCAFMPNLKEKKNKNKKPVSVQYLRPDANPGLKLLHKALRPRLRWAWGRGLHCWHITHLENRRSDGPGHLGWASPWPKGIKWRLFSPVPPPEILQGKGLFSSMEAKLVIPSSLWGPCLGNWHGNDMPLGPA